MDELRYAAEKYGRVKDVYIPKVCPTVLAVQLASFGAECVHLLAPCAHASPCLRHLVQLFLGCRTSTAAGPAASPLSRCAAC